MMVPRIADYILFYLFKFEHVVFFDSIVLTILLIHFPRLKSVIKSRFLFYLLPLVFITFQ